jgi:hypothetical protein
MPAPLSATPAGPHQVLAMMAMVVMAVPMAAVMDHAVVVVVIPAVLARRDDRGHGAEHADDGGSRRCVVVAVVVSAAGAGRQRSSSQCNRGRSSNGNCAAGHNTHFDFPSLMLSPSLEINIDLIEMLRRSCGTTNYVFAM